MEQGKARWFLQIWGSELGTENNSYKYVVSTRFYELNSHILGIGKKLRSQPWFKFKFGAKGFYNYSNVWICSLETFTVNKRNNVWSSVVVYLPRLTWIYSVYNRIFEKYLTLKIIISSCPYLSLWNYCSKIFQAIGKN